MDARGAARGPRLGSGDREYRGIGGTVHHCPATDPGPPSRLVATTAVIIARARVARITAAQLLWPARAGGSRRDRMSLLRSFHGPAELALAFAPEIASLAGAVLRRAVGEVQTLADALLHVRVQALRHPNVRLTHVIRNRHQLRRLVRHYVIHAHFTRGTGHQLPIGGELECIRRVD